MKSLDRQIAELFNEYFPNSVQGDLPGYEQAIKQLIQKECREAVEDFIKDGWGERCDIKDTEDFPDLITDPKANRCPTCEMWEHVEEYFELKKEQPNEANN